MKDLSVLPENYLTWDESVARVGGEEDFFLELLNDLRELVNSNLGKIENHIGTNNFDEIKELAHSMKGASGNLGLKIMYDTTLNLEQAAKTNNLEDVNKFYNQLARDYKHLDTFLNT